MKFFQTIDVGEIEFEDDEKNEDLLCKGCSKIIDIHNCYIDSVNKVAYCTYECYRNVMIKEYF